MTLQHTYQGLRVLDLSENIAGPPVQDLAEAMAHPVTRERALVRDAEAPDGRPRIDGLEQLRLPLDTAGVCPMREPPAVGQHTAQVLSEAGLHPDEIARLVPARNTEATVSSR